MKQIIDFDRRMDLVNEITENILRKGIIKERKKAMQIAKRWIRYN